MTAGCLGGCLSSMQLGCAACRTQPRTQPHQRPPAAAVVVVARVYQSTVYTLRLAVVEVLLRCCCRLMSQALTSAWACLAGTCRMLPCNKLSSYHIHKLEPCNWHNTLLRWLIAAALTKRTVHVIHVITSYMVSCHRSYRRPALDNRASFKLHTCWNTAPLIQNKCNTNQMNTNTTG